MLDHLGLQELIHDGLQKHFCTPVAKQNFAEGLFVQGNLKLGRRCLWVNPKFGDVVST